MSSINTEPMIYELSDGYGRIRFSTSSGHKVAKEKARLKRMGIDTVIVSESMQERIEAITLDHALRSLANG